jgi:hypothetical protein
MPDITMCANSGCPECDSCYRYKITPSEMQMYSVFEYEFRDGKFYCEYRIDYDDLLRRRA